MRTIDIRYRDINEAAAMLVAAAPARGDYWGVSLRARYATTRAADVVAQYTRTVRERAWAYGARVPREMRDRMRCGACGAAGCKMWREYNTCSDYTKILCGQCALKDQGKTGTIDARGYIHGEHGRCDQIGWMVPAVPTHDGSFWGYTSVPAEGVEWWRTLPTEAVQ
jgi:hypothetical protein